MSTRKRIWRALVLGSTALALLVLLAAVGVRVYGGFRLREAERRFVEEVGPLDPLQYAPTAVPEERNAANLLLGGAQAIVVAEEDRRVLHRVTQALPPEGWSTEDLARLRTILARNAAALGLLRQSRSYPDVNLNIRYREGLRADLPNLVQANGATRLLAADAAVAVMDGDLERAVEDIETLSIQARAHTNEPFLVVVLVGIGIERRLIAVATLMGSAPGVSADLLARVRASLLRPGTDLPTRYRRAAALQGVSERQGLLALANLDEARDLELPPSFPARIGAELLAPMAAADCLDRARALQSAFSGTKPHIEVAMDALQDRRSVLFGELFRIPNITAGIYRALGTESLRRLTVAGLDLRTEALRTGRYPDALPAEHLAPEPLLGSILRYQRQADGSAFLEVPGAEKSWKELSPRLTATFRWILPPPPALH